MSDPQAPGHGSGPNDPRSHASAAPPSPPPPPTGAQAPQPPKADGPKPTWKPAANSPLTIAAFVIVIVAGVLFVLAAWRLPPFVTATEGTEDAYVSGLTTDISPEVSGYVWRVPVEDFAVVKAGETLVTIDPRTYQQDVDQAKADLDARVTDLNNNAQTIAKDKASIAAANANVASAKAQLADAQSNLARSSDLVRDGSVSRADYDKDVAGVREAAAAIARAEADREQATQQVKSADVSGGSLSAAVEAAKAKLASARLERERTVIRAPEDGQLSQVGVHVGQYVTSGTQLFYLVPPVRWVTANYKEAQTRRMAVGQSAWIKVDALGGQRVRGRVTRLSPATGSQFSALKPDNATGNFTKVPERISVRIDVDADQPLARRLKPGMSVETYVDTASGPGPQPAAGPQAAAGS